MRPLAPAIKALTVCPGYLPFEGQYGLKGIRRGLVIDLTEDRSVHVVVTDGTIEQTGASEQEYSLTQPLVTYYESFLKGGACPSAPAGLPTTHQLELGHEGGFLDVVDLPETREPTRVKAIRGIVEECQAHVVEGVLVDLFSAGTFLCIFDALKPEFQKAILALPIDIAIKKCYEVKARVDARKAKK